MIITIMIIIQPSPQVYTEEVETTHTPFSQSVKPWGSKNKEKEIFTKNKKH